METVEKNIKAWYKVVTGKWLESQKEGRERLGNRRNIWIYPGQFSKLDKRHQAIDALLNPSRIRGSQTSNHIQLKGTE